MALHRDEMLICETYIHILGIGVGREWSGNYVSIVFMSEILKKCFKGVGGGE